MDHAVEAPAEGEQPQTAAELLGRLKAWFTDAEDSSYAERKLATKARDYRDGNQLTSDQLTELNKRGQPPMVDNQIGPEIDWLVGWERSNRTDPRAFPRTPAHEEQAEVVTEALRFVSDRENFDRIKSCVWEAGLVEGVGGVEITHKMRRTRQGPQAEIALHFHQYDRLFWDPHSRAKDFSDARYLGTVVWSDADDVKREYPAAAHAIGEMQQASHSDTYDDKPVNAVWASSDRKRVRIVVCWWKEGEAWFWAKYSGATILDGGRSPYVNHDGESLCGLELFSIYVDREGDRYGFTKWKLDLQDEVNARRSRFLHLLNSRQTWGAEGAVNSVAEMKRQMSKADGHVALAAGREYGRDFGRFDTTDMSQGNYALLQDARESMRNTGVNEAMAGDTGSESGRAVLAKRQGGMLTIAPHIDELQMWSQRVYTQIWARIQQLWTEERWIRVTDDERKMRFTPINRRLTVAKALSEMDPRQRAVAMQQMGIVPNDSRLGQVIQQDNIVAELDMDIIIEEVPDTASFAHEVFEQMVQLDSSRGGALPLPMLVKMAPNLPASFKEEFEEWLEQDAQQKAAMQQQAAAIETQKAQGEIAETRSSAIENMANADRLVAEAAKTRMEALAGPVRRPAAGVS